MNQQEFQKKFGIDHEASDEEIDLHVNRTTASMEALTLPWTNLEELIAAHSDSPDDRRIPSSRTHVLLLMATVLSAALPMVAALRQSGPALHKQDRYLV